MVFYESHQAADVLKIDAWPAHWQRLQKAPTKSTNWFYVMSLANSDRIDVIIELAEKSLPLKDIASGPADEMGLGSAFEANSCLGSILQELGRFPGKGFKLVEAGLKSPVVRNRKMAIRALSAWGKANWPATTKQTLESALKIEPNDGVRKWLQNVIESKPLDD